MKHLTSMTSKGQVTIPKDVRDRMGLRPFDKIEVVIEDGETKLRKAYPSLDEVAGSIPAIDVPMDEWDAIVQDEAARRYADEQR